MKRRVLFVTYGGGHVSMVVPVAKEALACGLWEVEVLALTSAAVSTRAAGLKTWQFKDFVRAEDAQALAWGSELASTLEPGGQVEPAETQAYLGLSFADLVAELGESEARAAYRLHGRHRFFPLPTLLRILRVLRPDLVVMTNSPRAERAAAHAAKELGIAALCINSMLAIDEIAWLGDPNYCDRVCVLNERVREFFIRSGRRPDQVVVTGNPSFDSLFDRALIDEGRRHRARVAPDADQVVLWASQPEYVSHPTAPGLVGDPDLPLRIQEQVLAWAARAPRRHVIVRSHPNQHLDDPKLPYANLVRARECDVAVTLHASDLTVTMTSTVALQSHTIGVPVLQVRGSIFDHSMPIAALGLGHECSVQEVVPAIEARFEALRGQAAPDVRRIEPVLAAPAVVREMGRLLGVS